MNVYICACTIFNVFYFTKDASTNTKTHTANSITELVYDCFVVKCCYYPCSALFVGKKERTLLFSAVELKVHFGTKPSEPSIQLHQMNVFYTPKQ